jgi:hypothetical protein
MNAQAQDADSDELSLDPEMPDQGETPLSQADTTDNFAVVNQEVPVALEHALIRTMAMLQQHNLASAEDCSQVSATVRRNWEAGKGSDPIDCLARLRAGDGGMLDASIDMISVKLAHTLPLPPTRVPFAGRLIPPTALYEKNPDIEVLCRLMLVPISYAEDLDVMGLASINPYFVDALSTAVSQYAKEKTGIQPIISTIRLDYVGWVKMCKKHFREGVAL